MIGYLRFETRRMTRDMGFLIGSVIMPLAMYLIFTHIGALTGQSAADGAMYSMIGMAGFGAIGAVLNVGGQIVTDRASGWIRQLRTTPLPPLGVVGARALTAMLLALPVIVVICAAGALLSGVSMGTTQWALVIVELWLGVLPFALLGLGIGHLVSAQLLPVVNMLAFLGMALLGGLWMPISVFPGVLQAIGKLLPTHGYGDISESVAFGDPVAAGDWLVLAAWLVAFAGFAVYAYRRSGRATA